jgi:CheY-like chemotaxis protein
MEIPSWEGLGWVKKIASSFLLAMTEDIKKWQKRMQKLKTDIMKNEVEILLVEDNPSDAELALRALKKNNLANNVIRACDGEEALDFIFARGQFKERKRENGPKVILLDLKLPKIDGLEVLRIIKADPVTKIIPVVVLTSSKEEKDMIESYRLGVNSYIVKPVDFDQFTNSVRDIGLYWLLLNELPDFNNLLK